MDLLDRYLLAVRHNLPSDRAQDITAELREELLDRLAAHEATAGHPVDESETADILKTFGHPYVVAARFREHQYLIGPQAYPFYLHALRIVAVVTLAVFFLSAIAPILTGGHNPTRAILQGIGKAWNTLFTAFAIVTILFALFERRGFPARHLQDWTPSSLPDYRTQPRHPWSSAIEVGFGLAALLWWVGLLSIEVSRIHAGFQVAPGPIWTQLYWPILLLLVAGLLVSIVGWQRPHWDRARLVLGGGTLLGGLWLVHTLLGNAPWVIVTAGSTHAAEAPQVQASLNGVIRIALAFMALAWSASVVMGLYRLVMRRRAMAG